MLRASCIVMVLAPGPRARSVARLPEQPEHIVGQGDEVDAAVLVEAFVLGVQQGVDELTRHLLEGNGDAAALTNIRRSAPRRR